MHLLLVLTLITIEPAVQQNPAPNASSAERAALRKRL